MRTFGTTVMLLLALSMASSGRTHAETPAPSNTPMAVKYQKIPSFDRHHAYRYELIHQAMEITRPDFGDYVEQPYVTLVTPKRQAQLLSEGDQLNIAATSPGTETAKSEAIAVPFDFLKGLLGYRICLTNGTAPLKLDSINNVTGLFTLKIGQGPWPDLEIYRFNNITPQEAPNFESLFMMLSAKRFDCLPLGANEVMSMFQEKKVNYPFLAMDTKLVIYYDFPIYFYVSKNQPRLAKRLEIGLDRLQKNGTFEALFQKYHAADLAALQLNNRKIICLKTPFMDAKNQCMAPIHYPKATP